MSDSVEVGGRRARGARRRLSRQNIEDVLPTEVQPGDLLMHESFRDPMKVSEVLVVRTTDDEVLHVTIITPQASWQVGPAATVRRIIQDPEEAEA